MLPLPLPQRWRNLLQPGRRLAFLEACIIGLVAATAAICLKTGVGWLGGWRVHATHLWATIGGLSIGEWFVLPAFGLAGGLLTGWLVEQVAPETYGSGIPQVKAVLAGFPMALNLRVALIKLATGIIALGSGLALGREGPTVQVGASLASQLSRWIPTSPDHRRQLIAAGAGAGLAAAFNAPIAGVLFVVEELLQNVSGLTLGTAILASFIGAVVSRQLGGQSLDVNLELATPKTSFFIQEIPFYLLLGVLAAFLGVLFNKSIITSLKLNRRLLPFSLALRVGLAGLFSGIVMTILPIFRDSTGLREILITGDAGWEIAAVAFVGYFFLTVVAYGSGSPGGLFAPTLILGAALGYLVGVGEYKLLGMSLPTTYALAGMGTFFSAVARVPITGIIIVFEITRDFNLVLPLMIGSVTSYLIAEKLFSGSLYDHLLELRGIHLDKETATDRVLAQLQATDVMQRRVETLSASMTLTEAVQAFSSSHHRGFPVVDDGKLVGIITQTDLAKASQSKLPGETTLAQIMTPKPVTVSPQASLADVLYMLNHYQLSRLPVIEERRLVGIITRSDLIRVEADKLSGRTSNIGPRPDPSYVVYQTRSPAVGQGRLLVPLANPETSETLLQLAAAIARDRHYEIECLQIIIVPRHQSPTEVAVNTSKSRRLLRQAENLGRHWNISIHTQVRVAHDLTNAILETINERHIDLIVMGWTGTTSTPGRVFGSVVDTVIRQVGCEVVLVKLSGSSNFEHWLVPTSGGPNAQEALQLLPALVSVSNSPKVNLCQVFNPALNTDTTELFKSAHLLSRRLSCPVTAIPIRASSVTESVIHLATTGLCDVVVLGASREGLLQQVIQGNIPEAIARGCHCNVILVRCALTPS